MTRAEVQAWLERRAPAAPPALRMRLHELLAACPDADVAAARDLADALVRAGLRALASLPGRDEREESVALDLLTADAFVTYAFEAAAEAAIPAESLAMSVLHSVPA